MNCTNLKALRVSRARRVPALAKKLEALKAEYSTAKRNSEKLGAGAIFGPKTGPQQDARTALFAAAEKLVAGETKLDICTHEISTIDLVLTVIAQHGARLATLVGRAKLHNDFGNLDNHRAAKVLARLLDQITESDEPLLLTTEIVSCIVKDLASSIDASTRPIKKDGYGYELKCRRIIEAYGFECEATGGSADFGVDLLATLPDGSRLAVQCKDLAKTCGIEAVQQVFAGAKRYEAAHCMVVCPSGFTSSATTLAEKLGVRLCTEYSLGIAFSSLT